MNAGANVNVNVDPTLNSTASELDADVDTDAGVLDAVGMAHEAIDDEYTNDDDDADEDDRDHDDDDDDDDHDLDNDDDLELSQDEDLDYASNSDSEHHGLSENEIGGPSEQELPVDKIHASSIHPAEYQHNIGDSKSQNYSDQMKPADLLSNQPKSPNSLASAKSHIGRMFTSGRSTSNSNNELSANGRLSVAGSAEQLSRIRSKSSLDRRRDSQEPPSTISASTSDVGRRRAPSIHIDSPSVEDSLGLMKKSLPHMVAASATATGNDASSVNSMNSSTDASDTSIKRRQTYFQKLGIFRAAKSGNDKLTPTGSVSSKTGFVLNRRHSSSKLKPSEDMVDDESSSSAIGTGGSSAFRKSPRNKVIKAGFIPISTKNKSYTELSRLRKVQLLPAGNPSTFTHYTQVASGGVSIASSGGGTSNREKAFSLRGSEIETPHIPVSGAILTMRFCQGGRYLATGGADCILRVFVVSAFGGANAAESIRSDPTQSERSNNNAEPLRNMSNPTPFSQTRAFRPQQQVQQQQKPTADSISLRSFKQSPLDHQQPSRADSFRQTSAPATSANSPEKLTVPATTLVHPRQVLNPIAYRTFAGHALPIQDLCWSRSNFLLSASSDKTVRLWHVQKASCLKVFAHDAVVSCVRFHPIDEGCFVSVTAGTHATSAFVGGQTASSGSGSASGHGTVPGITAGALGARSRLRVWSVAEKKVLHFVDLASQGGTSGGGGDGMAGPGSATGVGGAPVPAAGGGSGAAGAAGNTAGSGFVTALEFSKDGTLVITGTVDGGLYFHDFMDENALVYNTHVDLKPQGNIKYFRVTGVECLGGAAAAGAAMYDDGSSAGPADDGIAGGEGYVLVTATDGRIRLFNLRDKSLVRRYRGPDMRTFGGVKAVGSMDGRFAICGSEKGTVHIWDLDPNSFANRGVVADMLAAAGDFDDKKRASFIASGSGGADSSGANAPAGNAGAGGGGKNRFFSGLMQWQTDQGRYGESFRAADYSVLCAAFAPPNVRSILGLDSSTGVATSNLTGAFIAAADVIGNIHIFENEPPSGTSKVQDLHTAQVADDHQLAVSLGKRSFSSPANSGSNASLYAEQARKSFAHSPVSPTLESLHIELVGRSLSATGPGGQVDPFSSGVSFLAKTSLKSAVPPQDQAPQPQFVISPAANSSFEFEDCGVPLTNTQLSSPRQSRRRSYSSASSFTNIHSGTASDVAPWQEPPVSLAPKDGAEPSTFKSTSKLLAVGSVAQNKPSLMESWMHLRAHAKSVSVNKSALLDGAATSSNNMAPANATPASKLGGIFHRKRGATTADSSGIGAHSRSITTPASTAFSANNGAAHPPPSRLFQATLALVAMNDAASDQSTPPLTPLVSPPTPRISGRKSGNDLRRNGISLTDLSLNRESLSSDGRPVSKQPSASSLRSSASNRMAAVENFADELDKEETLETCAFCGGLQFSLTKGKKLVCIKCRKRLYDPLAPASISIGTYLASVALVVIGYIEFTLRAVSAVVLSLAVFPYLTAKFWKMWFNAWPKKISLQSAAQESVVISSNETVEPISSAQEFAIIQQHVYEGYSILLFLACLVIFGISLLFLARHVVLNTHVDRDAQIVREDVQNDEDIALMNDRARANRIRRNLQLQREQVREQDRLAAEAAQQAENPLPQNLGENDNPVVGPDVRNVQQNRMAQPPPPIEGDDDAPLPQPFTFDDLLRTIGVRGNIADMMLSFGIMLGAVIGLITITAFGTFGPMTISVLLEWFILEVYMPRAAVIVGIATEFLQKVTDPVLDPLLDYITAQLGLQKSNPEIIEAIADNPLKFLKWDAFDLSDYISDDTRHILSGYIVIGFFAYVYAKRVGALDHPYASAAVKSIIGNLKVAFFIMMDFLVLRPYCGFLVDLCTLSVFGPNNTLQKRLDHFQSRPILFYFIYWITGTVTMFQFIQYIEIARKHVRPGLFWFTLDPANPQFNPLQRFRERSLWKGLYTVLFNAMICTVYVLSAIGGITGVLHSFQLLFNLNDGPFMILPLRWEMRDPVSELSAVVIFVTVAFPLAKYLVEPKKRVSHALKIYLRFASHKLRVTEFTLGQRMISEENNEVGESDALVVKELSVNDAQPELAPSLERKPYLRVPKHDQIVKLPGETIMIAMSRTDPLVGKLGETETDVRANWRRVYAPAQFRARILALMVGQWIRIGQSVGGKRCQNRTLGLPG
ncbi:hypothetical protein HDU78_001305 [Chytriomyces hyalinus]|nr:hypothetical protein HDU78_001305 [Chytriomyces hyalinus]